MFEKKVIIFKKRDKEAWEKIKNTLIEDGLKNVYAKHYNQEVVQAGGCGSKLDPRDFSGKGKIDREIYVIRVKEEDEPLAREILKKHGLVSAIDDSVLMDASIRHKKDDYVNNQD